MDGRLQCPTSLVMNWAKEIGKWVGETRLKCIALAEASRDKAIMDINTFLSPGNQYPGVFPPRMRSPHA